MINYQKVLLVRLISSLLHLLSNLFRSYIMDKRSILFVITVSLALFAVNHYFDTKRQDSLKEWTAQQEAKQAKKQKELESEIAQRTAKIDDLPVIELYSDVEGQNFLASGVQKGDAIVVIQNQEEFPDKVYVNKKSYQKQFAPKDKAEGPVVYGKTPLQVAALPDFGHYEVQVVTLGQPAQVFLGSYTDGHFTIPAETLAELKKKTVEVGKSAPIFSGDALVLVKVKDQYYPTAYLDHDHSAIYLDEIPNFPSENIPLIKVSETTQANKAEEQYYVLENSFVQLVFSTYGGALAEINLPFQSKEDKESVVLPIEYDRQMVAQNPQNARFPSHAYRIAGAKAGETISHTEGKLGGYNPLIRRDLIEKGNKKSIHIPPKLYALNIVSEYPEVAELAYDVKEFTATKIVLEANQAHRKITKTFELVEPPHGGPYCLNLNVNIEGDARGLWLTSGVPEVEIISGSPAPTLKYRITRQNKPEIIQMDLPKDATSISSIKPDWICNSNGFLGVIMDPLHGETTGLRAQFVAGTVAPSRLVLIDQEYNLYEAANLPGYVTTLPLNATGSSMNFRVYAGPFADGILKQVDGIYSDAQTGYNPDYLSCISFHGWFSFISEPFAKFLFVIMNFFHGLTGSWGWSIILLTIVLRLMLYPLNTWSMKSTAKMQQIAPDVTALQERYKKDPKKAQIEIVKLYREKGVNPVSGCLPLLIQMPFLIGMFDLLKSTFELRGASFIPGWIDNLTAPDVIFSWNYPIFFIGTQLHLLPILLGVVMFFQQRLMSPMPKDQSKWTEQQRQQRVMGNMMTVVFSIMFYNFPSGLNIYWLSSMILGILQQMWSTKQLKAKLEQKGKPDLSQPINAKKGKR